MAIVNVKQTNKQTNKQCLEINPTPLKFGVTTIDMNQKETGFFHWDISVIWPIIVLKHAVTAFTNLYFRTLWPKWLKFFSVISKKIGLWPKKIIKVGVRSLEILRLLLRCPSAIVALKSHKGLRSNIPPLRVFVPPLLLARNLILYPGGKCGNFGRLSTNVLTLPARSLGHSASPVCVSCSFSLQRL